MSKKKEPRIFNCMVCGVECTTQDKRSKICKSSECLLKLHQINYHKKKVKHQCIRCDKEFEGKTKETCCPECKNVKFELELPKIERNVLCKRCNIVLKKETIKINWKTTLGDIHGKVCCKKCLAESRKKLSEERKGNKNVNYGKTGPLSRQWKGGKDKMKRLRNSIYNSWTLKILKRDNFTCQLCDKDNNKQKTILNVHHVDEDFSEILFNCLNKRGWVLYLLNEEQFKILEQDIIEYHLLKDINGITLCKTCHSLLHSSRKLKYSSISFDGHIVGKQIDREELENIIINKSK